ncbi:MAG: hypothetical protein BWY88_00988 [Synergistetes bacterium ADurb.Bin520]|nr:MAG: hypothetical protein BWY88_00988 [Synergistetes bacterium ADurb.Bin520]
MGRGARGDHPIDPGAVGALRGGPAARGAPRDAPARPGRMGQERRQGDAERMVQSGGGALGSDGSGMGGREPRPGGPGVRLFRKRRGAGARPPEVELRALHGHRHPRLGGARAGPRREDPAGHGGKMGDLRRRSGVHLPPSGRPVERWLSGDGPGLCLHLPAAAGPQGGGGVRLRGLWHREWRQVQQGGDRRPLRGGGQGPGRQDPADRPGNPHELLPGVSPAHVLPPLQEGLRGSGGGCLRHRGG